MPATQVAGICLSLLHYASQSSASFVIRPADLPDHAGSGDLHEWAIGRADKFAVGVGLAKIAHCPVIHEVGVTVWPEAAIHTAVGPLKHGHELLLKRLG